MSDTTEAAIDRGKAELRQCAGPAAGLNTDLMREELQAVIASPDFSRAPIMKRLLSFLVGETAAGRGDQLKAYSVAVDGLGRAPDYDARADSYPRVQVGRLRRMLDNYYASNQPAAGLRLAIPSGRYRVALQPATADAEAAAATAGDGEMLPERPWQFGWQIFLLLLLVLLVAMALVRVLPMRAAVPNAGRERPVLQVGGTAMAREGQFGNLVRVTLINGLARSNVFDLRALPRSGQRDSRTPVARYRLGTDLIEGDHPRLFLRLSSVAPDRLIWSGDISLAGVGQLDGEALDRTLAPMIASIGKVNGLIATHELQAYRGLEAAGYSCLLLYHRYRKERTLTELDHVQACLDRSLKLNPNNAEMQAAAAQLTIEQMVSSETPPRDRPALLLTARRHAQIGTSIDPFDAWANAASARVAVARGACAQAIGFATRAARIQPYDPALLSDISVYLLDCNDPRAESYARRAIALADDPDGRFYTPLLLLAIARDDRALAHEALAHMAPPALGEAARFHLISAAGYAMIGDLPRARAAWSQLQTGKSPVAQDPKGFFERLGYAADLQAKAIGHLRRARLIAG
ncbi:hypothetical protein [Rhizorhabdus dicambivorans]|uniref:hypothetical protein n=1 Tax=Rhizorhabdus dicambivorans TaxID=1850238 RepID=UPI00082DCFA6|nr:hypothetical protein [Rhizorhabdus dicambivorans]